ncbi:hypothetical protein [Halorussus sp. AFM4]|uniref:hypothetical protein n=1 Tax=Halorussus sp. AFM4 TaxID=3421651 RepID=UPI003EB9AE03
MDAVSNPPGLTDFDASAALSAVRGVAGDDLRAFVEYDDETYNALFIAERIVDAFGGQAAIDEFAEKLHFNYKLDFTERDMYEDLYAPLGDVGAFAVFLDRETIIRYVGEREGIYVSVDPGANATPVVEALTDAVEADG